MRTMTYAESRAKLAQVLGSVVDDGEEVVIVANARHIMDGIAALEAGPGQKYDLAEP